MGSAIWNNLQQRGYTNLTGRSHQELDLTDQVAVKRFFDEERPEAVVLAAAFVGGIMANSLYRADFIMMNMKIQCNVISEAYAHGVEKLLFLGYVHLPEERTAAHERRLPAHLAVGIHQRRVCHSEDSGSEDV